MRSVSSVALQLLRALEETLLKAGTHNQIVRTRPEIALYVLNHKRAHLMALEQRFQISIAITSDATVGGQPGFTIDRGEQVMTPEQAKAIAAQALATAAAAAHRRRRAGIHRGRCRGDGRGYGRSPRPHRNLRRKRSTERLRWQRRAAARQRRTARRPRPSPPASWPWSRRRRAQRRTTPRAERRASAVCRGSDGRARRGEMPAQHEQSDSEHAGEPGEGGFAPQPHGDPNGNGEARHRRRGRRGGRRNRRGRDRNGAPLPGNGNDQPHGDFQGGDGNHQDFGQQPDTSHGGGEPRHEHNRRSCPLPNRPTRRDPNLLPRSRPRHLPLLRRSRAAARRCASPRRSEAALRLRSQLRHRLPSRRLL